jgi:hypothetical protein
MMIIGVVSHPPSHPLHFCKQTEDELESEAEFRCEWRPFLCESGKEQNYPEEEDLMHKHASLGTRILELIAAYSEAIPIVLQHHELLDGTGYLNGLAGEAISLEDRMYEKDFQGIFGDLAQLNFEYSTLPSLLSRRFPSYF